MLMQGAHSPYKKLAVQWLNLPVRQVGEALFSVSSFVVAVRLHFVADGQAVYYFVIANFM